MGAKTNRFVALGYVVNDPILMKGRETTGRTILQVVPDYNGTFQYAILPVMAVGKKAPTFCNMVRKGDLILCEGRILTSTKITPSGKYYVKPLFKILDFMILKRNRPIPIKDIDVITTMRAYSPEIFMRRKEEK